MGNIQKLPTIIIMFFQTYKFFNKQLVRIATQIDSIQTRESSSFSAIGWYTKNNVTNKIKKHSNLFNYLTY